MQTAELLPDCVRFSCCSRAQLRHPLQLLFPLCLCSPIASAARCLHPLQLLLPITSTSAATPRLRPLRLLLPDYVRFDCCSPITLARLQPMPGPKFQPMPGPNVLEHSSRSLRFKVTRHYSLVPPHEHPTSVTHTHTHTHTDKHTLKS